MGDQVTLVPGWSRQIELPERADLLVAEIIGNEPFQEEMLETTLDARRRLLKPGPGWFRMGLRLPGRLQWPSSAADHPIGTMRSAVPGGPLKGDRPAQRPGGGLLLAVSKPMGGAGCGRWPRSRTEDPGKI